MALNHVFRANPEGRTDARIVRIASTLDLDEVQVTPNLLDEVRAEPGFIDVSEPAPIKFVNGALLSV